MMKIYLIIGSLILLGLACSRVNGDHSESEAKESYLCIDDYQTPEEAVEQLRRLASQYSSAEEWNRHADVIRKGIIKGAELDQIPAEDRQMPMNTIIIGRKVMDGYTVENIALEAKPGYFITGNIYKPLHIEGKIPAILNPHGHWFNPDDYGRFRSDVQKRCALFAKMGAVAFAYDMTGYGECHGYRHTGPKVLQYHIYNGQRVLDYLCSLDYVDTARIGMTGASSGGTQTILVAAVDSRIAVSVPVVMVSSHFFGGCFCDSYMPIHKSAEHETNNVEIAALVAPKPLLLVSDGDDWTSTTPEIGYPYIKNVYKLFHAGENVENAHLENEVHDYGISKRLAAYKFLAKHLKLDYSKVLDKAGNVDESFVQLIAIPDLKVFPDEPLELLCDFNKYSPYE